MKRLAIVVMLAFAGPGSLPAGDGALPLPTGMAPTAPQVPAPVLVDGLPVAQGSDWSRTSFRQRLGIGAEMPMPTLDPSPSGPHIWSRMTSWMPFGKKSGDGTIHDPMIAKTQWCENCAPAVRQPLPPLPVNLSTSQPSAVDSCAVNAAPIAAPSAKSGSCCQKLKDWICYRQTPVHFPRIPSPREPALYRYFPCQERPGLCSTGVCGAGSCAVGDPASVQGSCVACPAPGDAIVPGYRLAAPVAPVVETAVPIAHEVKWTSSKAPLNGR
jgi:hypothetical protein